MKSLYIASSHSFQEQAVMSRPDSSLPDYQDREGYPGKENYIRDLAAFNSRIKNLRSISCPPGDKWQEHVLYEEGKDYRLSMDRPPFGGLCIMPLPPTTEEAELWKEVRKFFWNNSDDDQLTEAIDHLSKNYFISRRSEQNSEAIEFSREDVIRAYDEYREQVERWKQREVLPASFEYFPTTIFKQKQ